jgi:hypothetical protein
MSSNEPMNDHEVTVMINVIQTSRSSIMLIAVMSGVVGIGCGWLDQFPFVMWEKLRQLYLAQNVLDLIPQSGLVEAIPDAGPRRTIRILDRCDRCGAMAAVRLTFFPFGQDIHLCETHFDSNVALPPGTFVHRNWRGFYAAPRKLRRR